MKAHVWDTEYVDGGAVGDGYFYRCQGCGASGGPVWDESKPKPTNWTFLAGTGLQLDPHDCEAARAQIKNYRADVEKEWAR